MTFKDTATDENNFVKSKESNVFQGPAFVRRTIDIWGTVITIDVPSGEDRKLTQNALDAVLPKLITEAQRIDNCYSPFQPKSLVTQLRTGKISEEQLSDFGSDGEELQKVINNCKSLRSVSQGAFDPWLVPGGFDPCGYVKGWGAQKLMQIAVNEGLQNVCINAAGDLAVAGFADGRGAHWQIGVSHPNFRNQLCAVVDTGYLSQSRADVVPVTVATSGHAEQTGHILSKDKNLLVLSASTEVEEFSLPKIAEKSLGIALETEPNMSNRKPLVSQATVYGPDGGAADAIATALCAATDENLDESFAWFQEFSGAGLVDNPSWGALVVVGEKLYRLGAATHLAKNIS